MSLHNFDGPSVSLLQIKYLLSLVKQKRTAVLSVCILIGIPNRALSHVTHFTKKILSFVIIEPNMSQ